MKYAITLRRPSRIGLLALGAALLAAGAAAAVSDPPPKEPPPEAERLESGVATMRLAEGTGARSPDGNDYVGFHFILWTPAGGKFQSTYDSGQPTSSLMEQIAPAWRDVLLTMVPGEKRRLWVPEHLTPDNGMGPAGAVICDLELLGLRKVPDIAREDLKPPAEAERTPFGAHTQVLEEGTGSARDEPGSGALAHFTLYTEDGKVYDSTQVRNRPTFFPFEQVMPAFADVLRRMKEGERRRIWIPGDVANGEWVGSPKGMLIFDAQVISIVEEDVLVPQTGGETRGSG